MPQYTVKCQVCATAGTLRLTFAEYDEVQAGSRTLTCTDAACGGWAQLQFDPGAVAFVMKDGESGGWVSKAAKENKFRARHRLHMAKREKDHVFKSRLQPNYGGQLTGSWKEAKDAAYEATLDKAKQQLDSGLAHQAASESAKTYDPLVSSEVSGS